MALRHDLPNNHENDTPIRILSPQAGIGRARAGLVPLVRHEGEAGDEPLVADSGGRVYQPENTLHH